MVKESQFNELNQIAVATDDQIRFEDSSNNKLILDRGIVKGDVTIIARVYQASPDRTARYDNVSGPAVWALLHDFLA